MRYLVALAAVGAFCYIARYTAVTSAHYWRLLSDLYRERDLR